MDIGVYCIHPLVKLFGLPEEIFFLAQILPKSIDGQGTITIVSAPSWNLFKQSFLSPA